MVKAIFIFFLPYCHKTATLLLIRQWLFVELVGLLAVLLPYCRIRQEKEKQRRQKEVLKTMCLKAWHTGPYKTHESPVNTELSLYPEREVWFMHLTA